jgi:hypothetical protein
MGGRISLRSILRLLKPPFDRFRGLMKEADISYYKQTSATVPCCLLDRPVFRSHNYDGGAS